MNLGNAHSAGDSPWYLHAVANTAMRHLQPDTETLPSFYYKRPPGCPSMQVAMPETNLEVLKG